MAIIMAQKHLLCEEKLRERDWPVWRIDDFRAIEMRLSVLKGRLLRWWSKAFTVVYKE